MKFIIVVILFELIFQLVLSNQTTTKKQNASKRGGSLIDKKEYEDAFLSTEQLIRKYGYPVEEHIVETADGYLLTVYRIPRKGAIPAYFFHGMFADSGSAVNMGTKQGIGYILYDAGYDVWLPNARGTRFSRKHKYLDPDKPEFWNFSFHEFGTYDIPAAIDYIIAKTGFKKIQYIGYSLGTTAFWVMCDKRPQYRRKIIMMSALAPVGALPNTKSPLLLSIRTVTRMFSVGIIQLFSNNEFGSSAMNYQVGTLMGCLNNPSRQIACQRFSFMAGGSKSQLVNETAYPVVGGHLPVGSSLKTIIHYGQLANSINITHFDYGFIGNIRRYSRLTPPIYDLTKVTVPVALYYAENDNVSMVEDVLQFSRQLPNVKLKYLVPEPLFNHVDFMLAPEVKKLVFDRMIGEMRKSEVNLI